MRNVHWVAWCAFGLAVGSAALGMQACGGNSATGLGAGDAATDTTPEASAGDSSGDDGSAQEAAADATTDATSDATTCPTGQMACNGACTATSIDPANCGSCGNACAHGQVCSSGTCATSCGAGQNVCETDAGAYCANEQTDNANCGACGNACGAGQVCSGGHCASTCTAGQQLCPVEGGAPYCASTQTDNANCGACGNACGAGLVCSGGTCGSSCGQGETLCTPGADGGSDGGAEAGAPYCANTQTDNANCGVCGTACPQGETCVNGECGVTCPGTLSLCGSTCVDETSDPNNCGGCGKVCPTGEACSSSTCTGEVAAWTFDPSGNTADVTGHGYDAANTAATAVAGYAQEGMSFNGSTAVLTVPQTSFLDLSAKSFTVEAWLQPNAVSAMTPDDPVFVQCAAWGTDTCLHMTIRGGVLYLGFGNDDLGGSTMLSAGTGTWYHAAWVFDAATMTQSVYVNGVLDAQRTATGLVKYSAQPTLIGGAPPWQKTGFNGVLDEVKVYDYARPAADILEDASLLVHLPFDSSTADVGPNHLWTALTSGTYVPGHDGRALSFDGTSTMFQAWALTPEGNADQPFSFEAWINPTADTGILYFASSAQNFGGSCVPYLGFSGGQLVARVFNGTGDTTATAPTAPPTGQWSHVAETWSSSTGLTLYVNGAQVAQTSAPHNNTSSEPYMTLSPGANGCNRGEGVYSGLMDEVRVYSRVRTAAEVLADSKQ